MINSVQLQRLSASGFLRLLPTISQHQVKMEVLFLLGEITFQISLGENTFQISLGENSSSIFNSSWTVFPLFRGERLRNPYADEQGVSAFLFISV